MKFCNFLLRVEGIREASLEDMKDVVAKGNHIFRPQKQKFLYSIDIFLTGILKKWQIQRLHWCRSL